LLSRHHQATRRPGNAGTCRKIIPQQLAQCSIHGNLDADTAPGMPFHAFQQGHWIRQINLPETGHQSLDILCLR
jgi:hypothetical protein